MFKGFCPEVRIPITKGIFQAFIELLSAHFAAPDVHFSSSTVLTKAQRSLRPELCARITEKIVFNRLSYDVRLDIARLHIGRELTFLRNKGFNITADESIISFLMQRGFHPRLGARPLRDAIEKHLRGAIAGATLAEIGMSSARFVICGNELLVSPDV